MKTLKKPYEIKVIVNEDGTKEVSAHYTINTEYGDLPPKGTPIDIANIEDLFTLVETEVEAQVNEKEEIA